MKNTSFKFFEIAENEIVIVPVGNHVPNYMFLTNKIGQEICEKISTHTINEILNDLSEKYEVPLETLKEDLQEFISKLTALMDENSKPNSVASKTEQVSIQQHLIDAYYKRRMPYNVYFELTYNCNLRCPHCYLQNDLTTDAMYIDKEKVFEILDDLERLHVVNVVFTGGEATLHPNIIEILEYATRKNMLITLLTNGQRLNDELLEKLKDISLYDIRVSLYGNESEHDSFVKKNGAFKQVKKVLAYLQREKGIGAASYVITKLNYHNFSQVCKEFRELNIPINFTTTIMPTADGDMKPTDLRIADKETMKQIYKEANVPLRGASCSAGICRFRISPTGNVNPCEMMHHVVFGNLNDYSFSDILKSKEHLDWIQYFEEVTKQHKCNQCDKRQFCTFCPGLFYQETGSFERPSSYSCFIAECKKELVYNE